MVVQQEGCVQSLERASQIISAVCTPHFAVYFAESLLGARSRDSGKYRRIWTRILHQSYKQKKKL